MLNFSTQKKKKRGGGGKKRKEQLNIGLNVTFSPLYKNWVLKLMAAPQLETQPCPWQKITFLLLVFLNSPVHRHRERQWLCFLSTSHLHCQEYSLRVRMSSGSRAEAQLSWSLNKAWTEESDLLWPILSPLWWVQQDSGWKEEGIIIYFPSASLCFSLAGTLLELELHCNYKPSPSTLSSATEQNKLLPRTSELISPPL